MAKVEQALGAADGRNCTDPDAAASPDVYFRRADLLMRLQRFEDARACFLKVAEAGEASPFHAEACRFLGQIYEIGLGVAADPAQARAWYQRAGL